MVAVAGVIAHGGTGGAIVEALLALSIAGVFLAVYLRERRGRSRSDDDQAS